MVYLTCSSRVLSITARKSRRQELEVASYFTYTVKSTVQWMNACLCVLSSNPTLRDCRTQTQWVLLPTAGRSSHLSYYHQDSFPTGVLTGQLGLDNLLWTVTALVIPDCVTWAVTTTVFCCWLLLCFRKKMTKSDWRKKGICSGLWLQSKSLPCQGSHGNSMIAGRHGNANRKLADHVLIHTQEVDKRNRYWCESITSWYSHLVTFSSKALPPKLSITSPKYWGTRDQLFKQMSQCGTSVLI